MSRAIVYLDPIEIATAVIFCIWQIVAKVTRASDRTFPLT